MEAQASDSGLDNALLHALSKVQEGTFEADMDDTVLNQVLDLGCLQARLGVSGALAGSPIEIEVDETGMSQTDGVVAEVIFN